MKKEMLVESNDEAVDLSRRSMMGRFGLVASIACAAPVLMTLSTSAQANHKKANKGDNACDASDGNSKGFDCGGPGPWGNTGTDTGGTDTGGTDTNTSGW